MISADFRKYTSGAVGSFTHAVSLHGKKYECELEVWADGYLFRLVDPYDAPILYIRWVSFASRLTASRPGSDFEERYTFPDDDPFFSEVSNFIDKIENGPNGNILSSFEDAVSVTRDKTNFRRRLMN